MTEINLFGEPIKEGQKKTKPQTDKTKRNWENKFQKWSNNSAFDDNSYGYGCCGFGTICDYCKDNTYGRPCVRALNELLRVKHRTIDYNTISFEEAFNL